MKFLRTILCILAFAGAARAQTAALAINPNTGLIKGPVDAATFASVNGFLTTSSSGTVSSVGLSMPNLFTVTGSPVTTSGTLTAVLANQSANTVFAGPTTGAAATPGFRGLVAADIPAISLTAGISGILPIANGGTNASSVQGAGQSLGIPYNDVQAKSANFTVAVADKGKLFSVTTAASTITATLPAAATAGDGWYVILRKVDAGAGIVATSPATVGLAVNGHTVVVYTDGSSYFERTYFGGMDTAGKITISTGNAQNLALNPAGSLTINGGTLAIANAKTFTVSNTLTLVGTDATTMTFPTTSATVARTDAGQTFTGSNVIGGITFNANAATAFNSLTSASATDLTLTGNGGASLVLGNGANGAVGLNSAGTGTFVFTRGGGSGSTLINASGDMTLKAVSNLTFATNAVGEVARFASSSGNFLIGGSTDITGSGGLKVFGSTASTSTTTGAFQVVGGAGVGGALFTGAQIGIGGGGLSIKGTSAVNAANTLVIDNFGGISEVIALGSDASTNGSHQFISRRSDGSNSITSLTLANSGNATFATNVAVSGTTDASSTSTGSLQTLGGLGVAKQAQIGTTLSVNGSTRVGHGAVSSAAWGLTGIAFDSSANTSFTDTTSSGTVATLAANSFTQPTVIANSATTYSDATNVYIGAGWNNGGNATFSRSWGLWSLFPVRVDSALAVTSTNGSANAGIQFGAAASNGDAWLYRSAAGTLAMSATTASTSTTTGALVVSGGVGIAGNTTTGGVLTSSQSLAANTGGDGLVLINPAAATSGNQSYSPRIRWTGQGWKTVATAGSQTVDWINELRPVQAGTNPNTQLVFAFQKNAGGFTDFFTMDSGTLIGTFTGGFTAGGVVTVNGMSTSGNGNINLSGSSGTFQSPTGNITLGSGAITTTGTVTMTPPARASGSGSYLTVNIPADTAQTAATESIGYQHVTATRQWASTGTVALQRENFFAGPTYTSAAASQTFTDVFNSYWTPPIAGSNATFTRGHTLGVVDSTSATSAITGGFIVATTLGTAATSVGLGGGNVFAGGNVTAGGKMTINGTAGTSAGDVATIDGTQTFTNKRTNARVTTISSSATPTVNTDNCDCVTITALAAAITSMTTNLSGTPVNFDQLEFRILDNGTARAITWGTSFAAGPAALPTTTTVNKALTVWFEYDSVQAKWMCQNSGSYP